MCSNFLYIFSNSLFSYQGTESKAGEEESSDDESEESEQSLRRLCSRQQKDALAVVDSNASSCRTLLGSSRELPQLHRRKNIVGSSQQSEGHEPVESEPISQSEGSDSSFLHTQLRDKGKKPIHSRAVPGSFNSPTEDAIHNHHNAPPIVTKNKQSTEDSLQLEVPLAVIHPGMPLFFLSCKNGSHY